MAFDHYDSTNSAANKALTEQFYLKLEAAGHISRRSVAQFYDPAKGMFLPDRYVRASARTAAAPTSTVTTAKCAARPMRRPT